MRRTDPQWIAFQRLVAQQREQLAARYGIPADATVIGDAHPPEAPWRELPPDAVLHWDIPDWVPIPVGPELDALVLGILGWTDIVLPSPSEAVVKPQGSGRPPGGGRRRLLPRVSTDSGAAWEWVVEVMADQHNWTITPRPADRPSGRPNWRIAWEGAEHLHALESRTMPLSACLATLRIARPHGPEPQDVWSARDL